MQNNIHIAVNWPTETPESTAENICKALQMKGYEINPERKDYRLAMFRKNERQWSQIYKRTRGVGFAYITVCGPEKAAATKEFHG